MKTRVGWRRVVGWIGKGLAGVVLLVLGVVAIALAGLNLPFVRRTIAAQVNRVLASTLSGTIAIERIGRIDPFGIAGARVRARDPNGRFVFLADGVSARVDTVRLVRSLFGGGALHIDIGVASVDHVDLSLDTDPSGELLLLRAVVPRASATPSPTTSPGKGFAGVRLNVVNGFLRHAWVHGRPFGGPPLDVELRDADASVGISPHDMEVVIRRSSLLSRGMPEGANPRGNVTGHVALSDSSGFRFDGHFDGDVGGLPTSASAALERDELTATLVSRASADVKRTLVPEVQLFAPLVLHADASGRFEKLAVRARAELGRSVTDIDGEVSLSPTIRLTATVHAAHVDLRDIAPRAPGSDISALASVSFAMDAAKPHAEARLVTLSSRVGGQPIPVVTASGQWNGDRVDAKVLAERRGARAHADICLRRARGETWLDVDLHAKLPDFSGIPPLSGAVSGRGNVSVVGTMSLDSQQVRGHVVADASDVTARGLALGRGFVDATVNGLLTQPSLDATLAGEDVTFGKSKFRTVAVHVGGTLSSAVVAASAEGDGDSPSLAVNARVEVGSAVTLRDVSVVGKRHETGVVMSASAVRIAAHDVRVEHAVIVGLGEPIRADARLTPYELRLRVDSSRVDLGRVASVAGTSTGRFHGNVAADVDLVARRSGATGHANVDLTGAAFGDGTSGHGNLHVDVDKDRIVGSLEGTWSGSRIELKTEGVRLGGPPMELASWARAFGQVSLDAAIDLRRLRKIVPDYLMPFEELGGRLEIVLGLSRKTAGATPEATLSARTVGFVLSRKGSPMDHADGTAVRAPARWRVSGIDFDLDAMTDRQRDQATLHGRLRDSRGTVLDVVVGSRFPSLSDLTNPSAMRAFLEASPVEARIAIPRRNIADFPSSLGRTTMEGSVEFTAETKGTLREPHAVAAFDLRDFKVQHRARMPVVGAHLTAAYDGMEGKAALAVTAAGKQALSATALGHLHLGDLLAKRADSAWDASARVHVERLPLESIPALVAQRVRGDLTGNVELSVGSATPPALHAKLNLSRLAVGRFGKNKAFVQVDANERTLEATAQVTEPDGSFSAKAVTGVTWPALVAPHDGPTKVREPAHVNVQARNFRLATLRPLVRSVVSRLDGRVDADVQIDVAPDGKTTSTRGQVQVKAGVFELPDLGEEFQDVRAKATFDANGVIAVDDVYAHGTTGSVSGSGVLRLEGLQFVSARGDFSIPSNQSLPVAVEGQVLADAWGKFHAEVTRSAGSGELDVKVEVPVGGVRLPDKSTRSLQPLEPADRVRVGVYRAAKQFEVLEGRAVVPVSESSVAGMRIAVHLKDMEVRRGTDLRVRLEGSPLVKTGKDAGVTGAIVLREGFLEVEGKRFEIERGTITFVGEADNPEVVVTAGWTAPEGTRVYADFVGPLKTGKVTLRSEPAYTNSEILSLILFGTTSGSSAPMAPGTTSADAGAQGAAGIGGGFAAQGLNRALDDITGLDITARVDTSDSANPRPGLELRIARDISVAISHVLGVPPPGANPDYNFATFDWRFLRNWSLESTFGDAGSSMLDFVWQYRY